MLNQYRLIKKEVALQTWQPLLFYFMLYKAAS